MTPSGRRVAVEMTALRDVQLEAHEVDPGSLLDEAMLGRQPGVDLQKSGRPGVAHVEERQGRDAAV
ncbi:MAG TPA: hypothetical protein VIT64_12205, partial [Ilumatobacteraceae bacterium]